jgi:hypothetical protein
MAQFEVFVNPLASARRAYPFVVVMQADIAAAIRSRDLIESQCSIAAARRDLLAAIDYLFFGV